MTRPRIINSEGRAVALVVTFTRIPGSTAHQADMHSDGSCTALEVADMLAELVESFKSSPVYLEAVFEHVHHPDQS